MGDGGGWVRVMQFLLAQYLKMPVHIAQTKRLAFCLLPSPFVMEKGG